MGCRGVIVRLSGHDLVGQIIRLMPCASVWACVHGVYEEVIVRGVTPVYSSTSCHVMRGREVGEALERKPPGDHHLPAPVPVPVSVSAPIREKTQEVGTWMHLSLQSKVYDTIQATWTFWPKGKLGDRVAAQLPHWQSVARERSESRHSGGEGRGIICRSIFSPFWGVWTLSLGAG